MTYLSSKLIAGLFLFAYTSNSVAHDLQLLSKPYPGIELFPEEIMKPYEASDFPWLEKPEAALPSSFYYILKPFFMQSVHWLC